MNNGMLRHSLGRAVIFIYLQNFNAPALDLTACLPFRQRREAINGGQKEKSLTIPSPFPPPLSMYVFVFDFVYHYSSFCTFLSKK